MKSRNNSDPVPWSGTVVLVNPPYAIAESYHLAPPLGLLIVARSLSNAGSARVLLEDLALDFAEGKLPADGTLFSRAAQQLAAHDADVYGFSVQCFNFPIALGVAHELRLLRRGARIIFGGHQSMLLGKEITERFPWVDEVVMERLELGADAESPMLDWTPPDYSIVPSLARYCSVSRQPTALVQIAEGCPYSCTFCSIPIAYGHRVRHKPIEQVLSEVGFHGSAGLKEVHFIDDIFTLNQNYIADLMDHLSKSGGSITWTCMTRVDRVNPDLLSLMASAGCHSILYGVESASPYTRSILLKRGNKYPDLTEFLIWNLDAGICATLYFLVNVPGDTISGLCETLKAATRLSVIDPGCCRLQLPRIVPGTELWRSVADHLEPSPETPYSETLRQTFSGSVEQVWHFVENHPDLFSTYCLAPGPVDKGMGLALAWFGSTLLKRFPLTLSCLAELGLLLALFSSISEARGEKSWREIRDADVLEVLGQHVQKHAPDLFAALAYEAWRDRTNLEADCCDLIHMSCVDPETAACAARKGLPILPSIYGRRRIYERKTIGNVTPSSTT